MEDENKRDPGELLFPEEKNYLIDLHYYVKKDVFDRDICSRQPNGLGDYILAVAMLAKLIGYRDHWDKDFQKARVAFRKVYV